MIRVEHEDRRRTPEENLIIAVIGMAAQDYLYPPTWSQGKGDRESAKHFCESEDIIKWCSLVGFNGQELQRRIRLMKAGKMELPLQRVYRFRTKERKMKDV